VRDISIYRKLAKGLQGSVPELMPDVVAHSGAMAAINPDITPNW
jgi:hypothetical protein